MATRLLTDADAPRLDESLDNLVVLQGIPIVPEAKLEKLRGVLVKVLGNLDHTNITIDQDENKASTGFAIIEFISKATAQTALGQLDGFQLDRKHKFCAVSIPRFHEILNTPEEWTEPKADEYDPEQNNLHSWLLDAKYRDQVVLRQDNLTVMAWNTKHRLETVQSRPDFTEAEVLWSPHGTYLATFHPQGLALWGTPSWKKLMRFSHKGARRAHFSPCERYLVTWSQHAPQNTAEPQAIIIWDVKTGERCRSFPDPQQPYWPLFRWSHDDQFFAVKKPNGIAIFETSTFMKLETLKKKDLSIPNLVDFAWSPTDNILAYWVPEFNTRPARVVLLSMPDNKQVASRNIFQVKDATIHWQKSGDHLCVKVDRVSKSKKQTYVDFQIFFLRQRGVPCDQLELKEEVRSFFWEPVGNRFAIVQDMPRSAVSFYEIEDKKIVFKKKLSRSASVVSWSPKGRFCAIADMDKMGGTIDFYDSADEGAVMGTAEQDLCTDISWDPTGRYLSTVVSYWRHQVDSGYTIWNFQGTKLHATNATEKKKFYQFLWRPRPKSLLDEEDLESIRTNWRKLQTEFEAEDKLMSAKVSDEMLAKRQQALDAWREMRAAADSRREERMQALRALRPAAVDEEMDVSETVETLESEEKEIVKE